jgi:ribosome-associated translation inhibitor RaiA
MDAAFDQLRRHARRHRRRLAEVARGVVDRELDLTSTPSPSSEPRDITG